MKIVKGNSGFIEDKRKPEVYPKFIAFFDGACGPKNPGGKMGWGIVVFDDERNEIHRDWGSIPKSPNNSCNLSEYIGFSAILDWIEDNASDGHVLVYGDSNLVIKQMFGRWKIKYGAYADLARKCKLRIRHLTISGRWIPREQNCLCDRLSKRN